MFGNITNPANEHLPDLNAREYATLLPLVALAFWIGIYPKPLFDVLDKPVHELVERVHPGYYSAPALTPRAAAEAEAPISMALPAKVPLAKAPLVPSSTSSPAEVR
jgi:NADH-quinone oxidoreductase subunit M